ncbi:Rha family transcriptional regulator [Ruminococcaceae bacterium OttesenSCG-928-I18]|nr:Rha family transcriptional regulator [Ruminococcaceae bacterium OttesenSCG-928-I18]
MKELVYLEPNRLDAEPFTTSDVVAEFVGITHRRIKSSIVKHMDSLQVFGKVVQYGATLGGRGNEVGYRLNEQQATLLMTFLKNTPTVIEFKVELVRQFYAMRTELNTRHGYRAELKPIRRELTDAIQAIPDVSKWAYKQYTDLAYKTALGSNAAQLRKARGADKKAAAIDYMTADEIHAVARAQNHITTLIELGMDYSQVKSMLMDRKVLGRIA